MKSKKTLYWNLCILAMVILSIITFSPLVIPEGKFTPLVFGLPRTLWTGIVVYVFMVLFTYFGTRVHPRSDRTKGETE
ncbi:hypothetical protein JW824_10090 [bacterium]|nr:hypothetical protein [bacterium]